MNSDSSTAWRLIASLLLLFIVVAAIAIWYVNPLTEQRAFGLLVSAELVAFSMLVYAYSRNIFGDLGQISKAWLLGGFLALAVLVLLSALVSA